MGLPEIVLEQKRGEKARKHLRIRPDRGLFLIGSSPEADLRMNGEGVSGCHAVLRFRSPDWLLCDVSGTESVKVNGQIVTEAKVDATTAVEIAGHQLILFPKERRTELFRRTESSGDLSLHQVVVTAGGRIVETLLLKRNEAFTYRDGDIEKTLHAPVDGNWVRTEIGRRVIQQRLAASQEQAVAAAIELDRDLKKPLASAFVLLVFLAGMVAALAPHGEQAPDVALDRKSMDIIFNAKAIKEKRLESRRVVRTAKVRSAGRTDIPEAPTRQATAPDESMAPKVSGKASKALTSLRQSGLTALVGKIARRANKQGVLVAAVGLNPDQKGSGRAFFSTGTSTAGGGGDAAKEAASYRLGGVATKGKAGGAGDFREGTALAGGSVGSGDIVAAIDEETIIEGGLDRDVIADVIRRNIGQIRYCYERQLSSNPDLYGKVLVKFTIGASGEVGMPKVDSSTLQSAMVEGCILRRLASWRFPLPKGGTEVRVSYPFLFKALD